MSWWKRLWEELSHAPYQRCSVCEGSGKIKHGYSTVQCEACDGLGHIVPGQEKTPSPARCPTCIGIGKVMANQKSVEVCPTCGGSGQSIPGKQKGLPHLQCDICRGTGTMSIGNLTVKCTVCGGGGYLSLPGEKPKSTQSIGSFSIPNWQSNKCPDCNGDGWVEVNAPGTPVYLQSIAAKKRQVCGTCGGDGTI